MNTRLSKIEIGMRLSGRAFKIREDVETISKDQWVTLIYSIKKERWIHEQISFSF